MKTSDIMVSVDMITYNHEKYIRDAIEGVLMQKTNFNFELVIGEDCSTDSTRSLCIEYKNKYPDIIKLKIHDKNIGMQQNGNENALACSGKYIAICEGDDFWTDPYKLQKQVDILEGNPKLIAVVTNSSVCDFLGNELEKEKTVIPPSNNEGVYNLYDFFLKGNQYPTATVMFRAENISGIVEQMAIMTNPFLSDWILWVVLHLRGDFYFINQVTAAYRINPTSLTRTVNALARWQGDFMIRRKLIDILPPEYHKYVNDDTYAYHMIGMAYRKQKKMHLFLLYQLRALIYNPKVYFRIMKRKLK